MYPTNRQYYLYLSTNLHVSCIFKMLYENLMQTFKRTLLPRVYCKYIKYINNLKCLGAIASLELDVSKNGKYERPLLGHEGLKWMTDSFDLTLS